MKKYKRELLNAIKESKEIDVSGLNQEVTARFESSVRTHESTEEKPVVIQCFGITNPDPTYCVTRKKSHNYVLEYVRSGKGYIEINDEKFVVNAGDTYLLYPETKEKYYSDKNEPFQKYWVNFVGSDIDRILDAFNIKGIHHFPKCNLMSYFIQLYSLEESYMNSLDFSYYAYSTIISMLVEMKKSLIANKKGVDTADKIKEIIDNHICENIKVLDICDELKMCKSSIINIFKNKYHITPNQYKNNKKMDVAKNMLINENISIKQISISLGFIDQYHFSNSFKKQFQMYPSEYRKMHFKDK